MAFKLLKRIVLYGAMAGLYLIGYCKGYDDAKCNRDVLEKFCQDQKVYVADTLEDVTDTAYHSIKKLIKETKGE